MNLPDRARLLALARRLLPYLLALLAVAGITVTSDDDRVVVTIPKTVMAAPPATAVDGPDADTKRDDALPLDADAQATLRAATKTPDRFDLGGGLRGPDAKRAGVLEGPLASQEWPGCKTAFVRAFSARTAPIRAIALHYTAGLNRTGWSDLDGLTAYSNNIGNGVSWHFGIDREGHCTYNVPINHKAWTISSLNSQTVNIEVIGTGKEPDYAGTAGMTKLRQVVQRISRITGVPIRLGATDGRCTVTRPGIITHWMGGSCSGGHIDIKPYALEPIIAKLAAGSCSAKCARARDLRRRHAAVHKRVSTDCRRSSSAACVELRRKNKVLHRAARREGVKL